MNFTDLLRICVRCKTHVFLYYCAMVSVDQEEKIEAVHSSKTFRVCCETEVFEAEFTDGLRARLESTYFAAALEGSPTASMMEYDDGVVIHGVAAADFRVIWDYLVNRRAPLIRNVSDYNRLLLAADYLCVKGFRDLREDPQFYNGRCVLTPPSRSWPLDGGATIS